MPADDSARSRRSVSRSSCISLAIIGAVFAALAMHTWRKWPDVLVDFGMQLYLPWKLSTGGILGGNLAYLSGGPLSQYYHSLLFRMFGVSLLTLVVSNLALLAAFLLLIHHCVRKASDVWTATAACLAVLFVFAFGQYTQFGIFNYVTPYSHEVLHGILLSALAIALLSKWFDAEKPGVMVAAGFACGLAFLTKPEVFLALLLSLAAALALSFRTKMPLSLVVKSFAALALAALVPVLGFLICFSRLENFQDALHSLFAGWIPLLQNRAANSHFYLWCLGLDAPAHHLGNILFQFIVLSAALAFFAFLFRRKPRNGIEWVLVVLSVVLLALLAAEFDWRDCGASLPPVCAVLLLMLLRRVKSAGLETSKAFPILWVVFSLGALAKLGLFPRIWHYGFALAMPAFLSAVYLLLWALPRALERFEVRTAPLRAVVTLVLCIGFVRLTQYSNARYSLKTFPVGSGADRIWASPPEVDPRGAVASMALDWLRANAPPGATLAVLPEGVMLNYLSRRPNPSGYPGWSPPEVAAFGQQRMMDDFERHSPDYVILVGIDSSEFGESYFGLQKRFGLDLMEWIKLNYRPVALIGRDWLKEGGFGMKIFQRATWHSDLIFPGWNRPPAGFVRPLAGRNGETHWTLNGDRVFPHFHPSERRVACATHSSLKSSGLHGSVAS